MLNKYSSLKLIQTEGQNKTNLERTQNILSALQADEDEFALAD